MHGMLKYSNFGELMANFVYGKQIKHISNVNWLAWWPPGTCFDLELRLLSVWNFECPCEFPPGCLVSFHLPKSFRQANWVHRSESVYMMGRDGLMFHSGCILTLCPVFPGPP